MITRLIKMAIGTLALGAAAYGFFLIPLGEHTLFDHLYRIGQTEEAQELTREVGEAGERVGDSIRDVMTDAGEQEPGQESEQESGE